MSLPGPVRFAIGAGLLTVANDFVVFVSPAGPVADEWSDLIHSPVSDAEIETALRSAIPPDHHLAFLKLVDAGPAVLATPGSEPIHGSVRRSTDGAIRFGMQPLPDGHWIGSGVVGASGFEVTGFAVEEVVPEPAGPSSALPATTHHNNRGPNVHHSEDAPLPHPPPPKSDFFTDAPPPQPPPPPSADTPDNRVLSPVPPPPPGDPPILSSALFPDLPTESDPPGSSPPLAIRFDDGQEVALSGPLAVGRAPEGSTDVPEGATIVVVSGDQVSRCHFVIRPCETGAEVIDTNSLNGCFLDDADRLGSGPQIPVGVPVPIEPGQRLRFGDRSFAVIPDQRHPEDQVGRF